jgi:adenylate cyclase
VLSRNLKFLKVLTVASPRFVETPHMEKNLAILMADLTGYTAMTDAHGGASAARIVNKYMQLVDNALHGSSRAVQRIGDQVVLIADNADDMVITAQKLNSLTLEEHHFLSIHAGLHYGPIFIENDNLFGSTVNVAARIMNLASRGQVLCSSQFKTMLTDPTKFKSVGSYSLKNLMMEFELHELLQDQQSNSSNIDPVCHMHIDVSKSEFTYTISGVVYHFCSDYCLSLFKESPGSFIRLEKDL